MRTLCKKAGISYFPFHPIRHEGTWELPSAEVAPNVIQEMLGHSNLKRAENYLHSVKGAVRDALVAYEESRSKFTTDSRRFFDRFLERNGSENKRKAVFLGQITNRPLEIDHL